MVVGGKQTRSHGDLGVGSWSGVERAPAKDECVHPPILMGQSLTMKISLVVTEEPSRNYSDLNEFILYDIHLRAIDNTIDGNISL